MPQYIVLAESVLKNIIDKVDVDHNFETLLTSIIHELRKEISSSNLKIDRELCKTFFIPETMARGKNIVDFSLIPRIKNKNEFILWLAGFIEKITIDDKSETFPPLSSLINHFPKIGDEQKSVLRANDSCNAINIYFKQQKT